MLASLLFLLIITGLSLLYLIFPIGIWDFVGTVVLTITLFWLIRYTRATEKMAEYQLMPTVDVNMIYEKSVGKTYFWFLNASNLPGIVYLEFQKNKEGRKMVYQPLRIPPKRSMRTAMTFEFSPTEGDKMIIYVSVKPALEKSNFEIKFEKSYTFTQNQWDENSWSLPDPPFPA